MTVFEKAQKHFLNQILTRMPLSGVTKKEVVEFFVMPLKDHAKPVQVTVTDCEHQLFIRRFQRALLFS
jgi:hypothetical protein